MSTSGLHQELAFQDQIASHLEAHGWLRSRTSAGYDKVRALFPEDLLGWLRDTQPKEYAKIVAPGLNDEAQRRPKRASSTALSRCSPRTRPTAAAP